MFTFSPALCSVLALGMVLCVKAQPKPGLINIGCVGDSITQGAHSQGGNTTYPAQLQIMLDAKYPNKYHVTNLGRSGTTVQDPPYGDHPYSQCDKHAELLQYNSSWDIIVVMLGTNDAKDACGVPASFCDPNRNGSCCNWPHAGQTNWTQDCSDMQCPYVAAYTRLLKTIQSFPKSPQLHTAIPPPLITGGSEALPTKPYGMNQTIINNLLPIIIPKINEANNLKPPINVFAAMGGTSGLNCGNGPERNQPYLCNHKCGNDTHAAACRNQCDQQSCDPCHPNDQGYTLLARTIQMGLGL